MNTFETQQTPAWPEPTLDERIERLRADLARAEAAAREAQNALYEALLEKAETTHVTRFDPELDPLKRWNR